MELKTYQTKRLKISILVKYLVTLHMKNIWSSSVEMWILFITYIVQDVVLRELDYPSLVAFDGRVWWEHQFWLEALNKPKEPKKTVMEKKLKQKEPEMEQHLNIQRPSNQNNHFDRRRLAQNWSYKKDGP